MGKAISLLRRQQVIAMRTEGHGYDSISCELGMAYASVRTICQRYKKEGQASLQTRYANSVKPPVARSNLVHRAALCCTRCGERPASAASSDSVTARRCPPSAP